MHIYIKNIIMKKIEINKWQVDLEIMRLKSFHRQAMSSLEKKIGVSHKTIRQGIRNWYFSEDVYDKLCEFGFMNIRKWDIEDVNDFGK